MQRTLLSVFASLCVSAAASGAVAPFTEHFDNSASNWFNQANTAPVTWVSGGGAPGSEDGYVSATYNFVNAGPGFPPLLFRGQGNHGSSGGAFVGDWLAGGITQLSFWVRHDATMPLAFFVRMTGPTNNPSVNAVTSQTVAPGSWTQLTIDIVQDNPEFTYSAGPASFFSIFGNLSNIQIGVMPGDLAGVDQSFTFDLDRVSVVPAPAAGLVLSFLGLARSRRRREC